MGSTFTINSNLHASSQAMNKLQAEFYILGTLNDYSGRTYDPGYKNILDQYYGQDLLINTIASIIKRNYPDYAFKIEHDAYNIKLYADSLSKKFNSYYQFKPTSRIAYGEAVLIGKLNADLINTEEKKMAFLGGVYSRFGQNCDSDFYISIPNSYSKIQLCVQLLTELGCKPYYEVVSEAIPNGHHLIFHPTKKVKDYLSQYSIYLKQRLPASTMRLITDPILERRKMSKKVS